MHRSSRGSWRQWLGTRTWVVRASADVLDMGRRIGSRGACLGQDLLGEGLWDLEDVGSDASLLETGLLCLGESLDVAVHRILLQELASIAAYRVLAAHRQAVANMRLC